MAEFTAQVSATPGRRSGPLDLPLLLLPASLFACVLAAASMQSARTPALIVATLAGLCGLAALARFAPGRTLDCLLIASVALVAVPIDAYLGYREHVGGWPGLRISLSDLCLYALLPLILLGRWIGHLGKVIPREVCLLFALLVLQYALSSLAAPRRDLALLEIASTLHAGLLGWAVAAVIRREHIPALLLALACPVILHSGFAIGQGLSGRPIGAGWLGGYSGVHVEQMVGGAIRLRPAGLFAHPIVYADFLIVTLPVLAAGLAVVRRAGPRLLLLAALALGFVGLVLTLSRGAWISCLIAFAALGILALRSRLLTPQRIRLLAVTTLGLGLAVTLAFGSRIYERMAHSDPGAVDVRYELNRIALRMTLANPLLGAGLSNFTERMEAHDPADVMRYFPAPVHNLYLLESAEAGIPGLLLFCALFAAILLRAFDALPRLQEPELRWLVAALSAAVIGFLVSQLADFSHRLEPLRSLLWCELGILFGVLHVGRSRVPPPASDNRAVAEPLAAPGETP